jgi:hypothetical protein
MKYNKNTIVIIPWEEDYMLLCFYDPFHFVKSVALSIGGLNLHEFRRPNMEINALLDKICNKNSINDLKFIINSYIGKEFIIKIGVKLSGERLERVQEALKKDYEFILVI